MRDYSLTDRFLIEFNKALNTVCNNCRVAERHNPALDCEDVLIPSDAQIKLSAELMRVNHAGEVAAQALYNVQAVVARDKSVTQRMQQSALEENDHLVWCEQRLRELNSHTSYLSPLWYWGSYLIGMLVGLAGDRWSLGFIDETEKQVVEHLHSHLDRLPADDVRSRAIVEQMKIDEENHARHAQILGAEELPPVVKRAMRMTARIMTTTARWI